MSVQTEIDRISTAVQNAHLKVIEKGGTSAAPYLVANLADAIDTIPEAAAPKLQAKTATPSETAQTVKPDSGYDGLSQVSVGAISKTYVGSGVTKQAAKTITPSTSSQTAVAKNVYTTGAVTVGAIPSTYVKPTATKAATTYTPSTSNQTIAAGTYCSGTQTIKGDANLVAGNIKSGVSIFGVAGSYEGSGGGSGGGTCTVEIMAMGPAPSMNLYYMDSTGSVIMKPCTESDLMMGFTLTVQANTPIAADKVISSAIPPEGDIINVNAFCYYVRGDGTIYISG